MTCGIYSLVFTDYEPFYIGQSVNIEKRYKEHLYALNRRDSNKKLLNAFMLHGFPELFILEETEEENLDILELKYITKFNTAETGLNEWAGPVSVLRGEKHPNSKYTDERIKEVIKLLALDSILSFKVISEKTQVSIHTIESVSSGRNYSHLKNHLPIEYSILESRKGSRKSSASSAKGRGIFYPTILSPNGDEFNIENISKFALENNLNKSHLCGVLNGVRKSHKRWKLK